jgi:peptidoglycan L-alanyl-D-glutamate endopeptidase CwlK
MYWPLKLKLDELLAKANEAGLNVGFYCGTRTFEQQEELYAKGRDKAGDIVDISKVVTYARGGQSYHNWGLAFDLAFLINGEWSWAKNNDWEALGELGESLGLEWGGRWPDPKTDKPHFQMTNGVSILQAKMAYDKIGGVEAVWKLVEEGQVV